MGARPGTRGAAEGKMGRSPAARAGPFCEESGLRGYACARVERVAVGGGSSGRTRTCVELERAAETLVSGRRGAYSVLRTATVAIVGTTGEKYAK